MSPNNKEHPQDIFLNVTLTFFAVFFLSMFCWAAHYSLALPLLLLFLGVHLHFFKKANVKLFLDLGLLLTVIMFGTHAVSQYTNWPPYYIPVAAIGMLTMLLFNDLQLVFMMSLISSLFVSLIVNGDFGMMITFFVGGLTGAYSVKDTRNRGQLMNAGLFVSIISVVSIVLLHPDVNVILTKDFVANYLYPTALNGFISVFVVLATLKIFEFLFGVVTNFSLLELSDFNQPLLKKMILEAPGTYHHSLVVSNLAEAAAEAIGANSLLARVGAYYHDIGKIAKPQYFTENQLVGGNKHDDLEPTISRLVVLNHVKEGSELAKKYHLNSVIIDFIPQHHGTSLMHYFYQRALEEVDSDNPVREEDFRYPGPKPQNRETAIVMLADSAEGATRSLDEHNSNTIADTVQKIINNKFIDGQLDECNLNLKDIEKISEAFVRILSAMYHGRVKYPEKKNGSHSKKSSEKGAPQLAPDYPNHKDNS